MKTVARVSIVAFALSSFFLFAGPIPQAKAAACTTPTQSSFTETGTTYTVQTFTTAAVNCTWNVPLGVSSLRILIVGGGGGAGFGACGGGGGAGRVLVSNSSFNVGANDVITLTIGNGGLGGWRSNSDWRMGISGDASVATINGTTITASGGGGGGGGATNAGLAGGSGGGGTACNPAAGGSADTSSISGFTSYANAGAAGDPAAAGGGGGGAGASGSNRNGGNGITIWGATFAGGGGGWGVGSGGSGGGGAAGNGTDPKSAAGNPGTAGTGSGGGGGNDGGSGRIMIRYLVNATVGTPSLSGTAYKGVSITITVTSTVAGRVRFFVSGKRISKCLATPTSGTSPNFSATCSWSPPTRGNATITATLTPTDVSYSAVTSAANRVFVLNKSTRR